MDKETWESMKRGARKAEERAKQLGQDPDNMLFSIGGKDTEVHSLQELNAAGQVMPTVCMPTSRGPAPIRNCHRMRSDCCGTEVYMSPATKKMFDKLDKKLILCLDCFLKQLPAEVQPEAKPGGTNDL